MSTDRTEDKSKGGGDTLETKAGQNGEGADDGGLTGEELAMTRRGAIGTGAALLLGAGYVMGQASQLEGDTDDDLYAAALTTSLTSLKSKSEYYSGPKSAFDPAELASGQLAIVPDDWGVAVKGEDGTMEVPSIGSQAKKVPPSHFEAVTTEDASIETLTDRVGGALWSGQDLSATHYKYVPLTVSDLLAIDWVADHRNPVTNRDHWMADDATAHTGGAPDPRVYGDSLVLYSEAFQDKIPNEDIYVSEYEGCGYFPLRTSEYIGNNLDGEQRVAPRVLYLPEQGGHVMFHADYASGTPDWNLSASTSSDGKSWTRSNTAILSDTDAHHDIVRVNDTLYWFYGDRGRSAQLSVATADVGDFTTFSHSADLSLNAASGRPTVTRCRDGWLLVETDAWGDVRAWSTPFDAFPAGWSLEGTNPFGFEKSESFSTQGNRNVAILMAGEDILAVVPGTDATGSSATGQSRTGFYRAFGRSKSKFVTIELPPSINPYTDETTSNASGWDQIGRAPLYLDEASMDEVYFSGEWRVATTGAATTSVRLVDEGSSTTLLEKSAGTNSFNIRRVGPFDLSRAGGYRSQRLSLEFKVSDGAETGTFRGSLQAGLRAHVPIGRYPAR